MYYENTKWITNPKNKHKCHRRLFSLGVIETVLNRRTSERRVDRHNFRMGKSCFRLKFRTSFFPEGGRKSAKNELRFFFWGGYKIDQKWITKPSKFRSSISGLCDVRKGCNARAVMQNRHSLARRVDWHNVCLGNVLVLFLFLARRRVHNLPKNELRISGGWITNFREDELRITQCALQTMHCKTCVAPTSENRNSVIQPHELRKYNRNSCIFVIHVFS